MPKVTNIARNGADPPAVVLANALDSVKAGTYRDVLVIGIEYATAGDDRVDKVYHWHHSPIFTSDLALVTEIIRADVERRLNDSWEPSED